MIHVIATIQIAAGRRADFLAAFQRTGPQVRAEAGLHRIRAGDRCATPALPASRLPERTSSR